MEKLNTRYPTEIYNDYLIDPSIMEQVLVKNDKKRQLTLYDYTNTNDYTNFIKEISSNFLIMNDYKHNKHKWYMDVIRYTLENDTKRVESGLAWHCENDNYPNVITILMYLKIDEGIIDGNIRYKDVNNEKKILEVKSGTTVIMDGNVPHKPQDPYGSGLRDLIIISFEKE